MEPIYRVIGGIPVCEKQILTSTFVIPTTILNLPTDFASHPHVYLAIKTRIFEYVMFAIKLT